MESNLLSMKSKRDVVRIATLLRDEGDRLLNFSCNLTLTLEFLIKLNEAFDLIVDSIESSCFQVINTNNSSEEFLHDLQFLHDFVQKISGLRLWSRTNNPTGSVGLDKFRALQFLDLHSVRVQSIKISSARDKLKVLTCSHCNMQDPRNLFGSVEEYETENSEGEAINASRIWASLEEMFLPYNDVKVLGSFLCLVPRLKILDLSHNSLTDLSALAHSSGNLEWLNVSYNRLKAVPVISTCTKLRVIFINDNQVADITGLHGMLSLQHINASNNLLRNHISLEGLANLKMLQELQLEGNPIAFKKGHRLFTAIHLNPLLLGSRNFILNGCPLSPMEVSHLNLKASSESVEGVFNSVLGGSCASYLAPSRPAESSSLLDQPHSVTEGQPVHSQTVDGAAGVRQVRIREASIADGEDHPNGNNGRPSVEALLASGSANHLETKRDIESLRKNFGEENWLHGGGGQRVLNILGLPLKSSSAVSTVSVVHDSSSSLPPVVEATLSQVVASSDDKGEEPSNCEKAKEVLVEDGGYEGGDEEASDDEIGEEKESGAELGVFVVQRRGIGESYPKDDLLLIVTDRFLIERDGFNGRDVAWRTSGTLAAVSVGDGAGNSSSQSSINLRFKNSYGVVELQSYLLEEDEAKELLPILQDIVEKNRSSSERAVPFLCLKCSASFVLSSATVSGESVEIGVKENGEEGGALPKCPECGSSVIVQNFVDEVKCVHGITDAPKPLSSSTVVDTFLQNSEKKDPIALWADNKLLNNVEASSEASNRGLHLHVLLNILPDGEGKEKEIDIQDVLVFQEASGEVFYGHMVISSDSVYILKEADKGEGRRLSGDESSAPVLLEWHPTQNCLAAVEACSGYLMKFGPQPTSSLWIFPRHRNPMRDVMNAFTLLLKDQELLASENERMRENDRLLGILMFVPAAVVLSLTSNCDILDPSNIQHGIIILTSSMIYFVEHRDASTFVYESDYVPSHSRRISDLIGLDAAPNTYRELPGVTLHFSSEELEEKCVLWPWSDGILKELLYGLLKPWEDIFSVPFEEILTQTTSE